MHLTRTLLVGSLVKNSFLSTIDKMDIKCDVLDRSVVNGLRQPILFSFISGKLPG